MISTTVAILLAIAVALFWVFIVQLNNLQVFRKILTPLGFQFVFLEHYDGERTIHYAYKLGEEWYAAPYLPTTRCVLHPDGRATGQCYIKRWYPITNGVPRNKEM